MEQPIRATLPQFTSAIRVYFCLFPLDRSLYGDIMVCIRIQRDTDGRLRYFWDSIGSRRALHSNCVKQRFTSVDYSVRFMCVEHIYVLTIDLASVDCVCDAKSTIDYPYTFQFINIYLHNWTFCIMSFLYFRLIRGTLCPRQ